MQTQSIQRPEFPLHLRQDAFRDLCAVYDVFVDPRAEPMPERLRLELIAYAQVLDVPVDHASGGADLWRQVRPLLAHETGPRADRARNETPEPTGKVFLPGAGRREAAEGLSSPIAPLSLLVVEDDPDLSAAIIETLIEAGHLVVAAASTAENAAALAAHHAIDFAIVDVELPGPADGVALVRDLHERWGLKALFMSGGPNEHLVDLPVALGFVGKPFSAAELLGAVTLSAALLQRGRA